MAGVSAARGNFPPLFTFHGGKTARAVACRPAAARRNFPLVRWIHRGESTRFAVRSAAAFGGNLASTFNAHGRETPWPAVIRPSAKRSNLPLSCSLHRCKTPQRFISVFVFATPAASGNFVFHFFESGDASFDTVTESHPFPLLSHFCHNFSPPMERPRNLAVAYKKLSSWICAIVKGEKGSEGFPCKMKWSERQDLNLRRLAPKASALARLSYAPAEVSSHEFRPAQF
jgi:hypothetical protein